jgi:hypothetical protein
MTLSTQEVPTATDADGSAVEIPSNFLCPITLQVMLDPLMTRTGLNFEKAAILGWLSQGSGSCPLTRKPLTASDLVTNRNLKSQIHIWMRNNDIPEPTEEEMEAADCKFVGFLKVSGDKRESIMAPHSLLSLTLASSRRTPPSPISSRRAGRSLTPVASPARQSGERRRNFLSRILNSATAELDEL